ncbi:MAG TPA: peptide-methionine (S)-S-oxide reductase MsrA [Armatimonadota bacterium]|nr:peptide-methionine (S)-S-oxide reductase MsrA [Armatimonadota bacterium]
MAKCLMPAIVTVGVMGAVFAGHHPRDTHLTDYGRKVKPLTTEKATFGGSCFWGVEAAFRRIPGVVATTVGYAGGRADNPTYEQVCRGATGHTEAVEIVYDPARITYDEVLAAFWGTHDPTVRKKTQYKSVVFYHTPQQRATAQAALKHLRQSGKYDAVIVTEILPAGRFYRAEAYHQQYYEQHHLEGDACAG